MSEEQVFVDEIPDVDGSTVSSSEEYNQNSVLKSINNYITNIDLIANYIKLILNETIIKPIVNKYQRKIEECIVNKLNEIIEQQNNITDLCDKINEDLKEHPYSILLDVQNQGIFNNENNIEAIDGTDYQQSCLNN